MLETGKVICPACGGEMIVEYDNLDIEVDVFSVFLFKVGECDHCGNHYQWREKYTLTGYSDLEQTNDENEDEPDDIDDDCGFDPYEGCYTYDC